MLDNYERIIGKWRKQSKALLSVGDAMHIDVKGSPLAGEMSKQRHNGIELKEIYREENVTCSPIGWFIAS